MSLVSSAHRDKGKAADLLGTRVPRNLDILDLAEIPENTLKLTLVDITRKAIYMEAIPSDVLRIIAASLLVVGLSAAVA